MAKEHQFETNRGVTVVLGVTRSFADSFAIGQSVGASRDDVFSEPNDPTGLIIISMPWTDAALDVFASLADRLTLHPSDAKEIAGIHARHKDHVVASAVADTLRGILPGVGVLAIDDTVGPFQKYFRPWPRFDDSASFTLHIDPGDAPPDVIAGVLRALSDLHIAAGGSGLRFEASDETIMATEAAEA